MLAAATALCFALTLAYWLAIDTRQPSMDEAGHILNGLSYRDLFAHPAIWKKHWWAEALTVNRFYPPVAYVFAGFLKLVLGTGHWVDILWLVSFDAILSLSIFGTTFLLTGKRTAAVLAACIVNLCPGIAFFSRTYLLDFPLSTMVSLGLFALVWWRQSPTWRRTLCCGLLLTLACLTKQVAAAFLAGPGLLLFAGTFADKKDGGKRRLQIFSMGLMVAAIALPWVVASYGFIHEFATVNQSNITSKIGNITVPQALVRGLKFYTSNLWDLMSPMLCLSFLIALVTTGIDVHKKLFAAGLTFVSGIFLISLLPWQFPENRYFLSGCIAPSIYLAAWLSGWLAPSWRMLRLAVIALMGLAVVQFISYSFSPYPLGGSKPLTELSRVMGVHVYSGLSVTPDTAKDNPMQTAQSDWGQAWVLTTINSIDPKVPVWLNILPDHVQFNPHTFELLSRTMNITVRPTSSREWTVMGDKVPAFTPESAMYFHWYLAKTGSQGVRFREKFSEDNFNALVRFVFDSGKFKLVGERDLPDGSKMLLYRQKDQKDW